MVLHFPITPKVQPILFYCWDGRITCDYPITVLLKCNVALARVSLLLVAENRQLKGHGAHFASDY